MERLLVASSEDEDEGGEEEDRYRNRRFRRLLIDFLLGIRDGGDGGEEGKRRKGRRAFRTGKNGWMEERTYSTSGINNQQSVSNLEERIQKIDKKGYKRRSLTTPSMDKARQGKARQLKPSWT